MGTCGDRTAAHCGIGRREQDDYALRSHRLARDAMAKGHAAREIAAVEVPRKKDAVLVSEDEGPKKLDEAKLRSLSPAFGDGGTVTAGNASSINDGAAAVLVASAARFAELGVLPIARILGYETFSREPEWFTLAPVGAIERLLGRIGIAKEQVDLFEINEAFAVVVLACARELGLPLEKVNVLGGAIALGHPIGASGARTLVTLLNALELRRARLGVVCLCVGGGEAVAMAVERI
jgi:acetyl-CoA C-acetyltransferase